MVQRLRKVYSTAKGAVIAQIEDILGESTASSAAASECGDVTDTITGMY